MDPRSVSAQSWRAYRIAFRNLAQRAREVQVLVGRQGLERDMVEALLLDMEKAHVAYKAARDRLAQELLESADRPQDARLRSILHDTTSPRVKELARLIWELKGRPANTAEADWLSAEEILRRAQAA